MRALIIDVETNEQVDDVDLHELGRDVYYRAIMAGRYRTVLYERTPIEHISRDDMQDEGC